MSIDLRQLFTRLEEAKRSGSPENIEFVQGLVNRQFLNAIPIANRSRALQILPYVDWSMMTPDNNPLEHVFGVGLWLDIDPQDFLFRNRESVLAEVAEQYNFDDMLSVGGCDWSEKSTTEKSTWTAEVLLEEPGTDEMSLTEALRCTLKVVFSGETCEIESVECTHADGQTKKSVGRLRNVDTFHEAYQYEITPEEMPGFVADVMRWMIEAGRADLFSRQREIPREYYQNPSSRFLYRTAQRGLIREMVQLLEHGCDPHELVTGVDPFSRPANYWDGNVGTGGNGQSDQTKKKSLPLIDFIRTDFGDAPVQAIQSFLVARVARKALADMSSTLQSLKTSEVTEGPGQGKVTKPKKNARRAEP